MGRKKTVVSINLDDAVLKWVDQQAEIGGLSRSAYIEAALQFGAEYTPIVLEGLGTLVKGYKDKDLKAREALSKPKEAVSQE